jgi:hypothetical protein
VQSQCPAALRGLSRPCNHRCRRMEGGSWI